MVATAKFGNTPIAEAEEWETVEGSLYFPPSSIKDKDMLTPSNKTATCPWKGEAHYYNIELSNKTLKNAVWYYSDPKSKAANIRDHLAFDKAQVDVKFNFRRS